jgi:hypothetical protein
MMAISYALPLIAIGRNKSMVDVTYLDFIIRFDLVSVILMAMGLWWHRNGWARPRDARALSWENAIFLMARWPWSLLGVAVGMANVLSGREANFRITPKRSDTRTKVPFQVVLPYILLSLGSSWCVLSVDCAAARGYDIFACVNAISYALILAIILAMHWAEGTPRRRVFRALRLGNCAQAMAAAAVLLLALAGTVERGPQGAEVLLIGAGRIPGARYRLSGDWTHLTGDGAKHDAADITDAFGNPLGRIKQGMPGTRLHEAWVYP